MDFPMQTVVDLMTTNIHPLHIPGIMNGTNKEQEARLDKLIEAALTPSQFAAYNKSFKKNWRDYLEIDPGMTGGWLGAALGKPTVISMNDPIYNTPEILYKRDRQQTLTIDDDPRSKTYKQDLGKPGGVRLLVVLDHVEQHAPFAVGCNPKDTLKEAMWRLWGNVDETDMTILSEAYTSFTSRTLVQWNICMQIYETCGVNAVKNPRFNDAYIAYLFLYARATTQIHPEQLLDWKNNLAAVAHIIVDPAQAIKQAMKGDISTIASVVGIAIKHLQKGDELWEALIPALLRSSTAVVKPTPAEIFAPAEQYLAGLTSLAPWLAMEWFMVAGEDTQNLASVEIELHLRLATWIDTFIGHAAFAGGNLRAVFRNPFATNQQVKIAAKLYRKILQHEKETGDDQISPEQFDKWLVYTIELEKRAAAKPQKERWHVAFVDFSLRERMEKLRGLNEIMPNLFALSSSFKLDADQAAKFIALHG